MQSALGALQVQQQQRVGAPRSASAAAATPTRPLIVRPVAAAAAARRRRPVAAAAAAAPPSSPASSLRPLRRRRRPLPAPPAAAADPGEPAAEDQPEDDQDQEQQQQPQNKQPNNEERKEYYDAREMPPLPLTVARVVVPELGHVVVDGTTEPTRLASLAIFTEMWRGGGDNYGGRLNRRSAITALCMYDRDDVAAARAQGPGLYPSIDLLERVYREGLDVEVVVEEK